MGFEWLRGWLLEGALSWASGAVLRAVLRGCAKGCAKGCAEGCEVRCTDGYAWPPLWKRCLLFSVLTREEVVLIIAQRA